MKVLHLTTHLNTGGITVYIYRLIRPLLARGIETHVLSSGGDYEQKCKDAGAYTEYLNIRTKSELSLKVYFSIWPVCKYIRENKIDVIHAHSRVTQVLAFWVQKFTPVRVVTTTHGFYKRRFGRRLNPAWGDLTIVISRLVGEALVENHKVDSSKIRVVHNGVDVGALDKAYEQHQVSVVRQKYGIGAEDPVVGIIARLVEDKGHGILLQAIADLRVKRKSNIRLLITGEGPYRKCLEKMAQDLNLRDNIYFTGNIADITEPLVAMDVVTLPVTWREGFGLSIIEAMACKKPIIVSDRVAIANIIKNAHAGDVVRHNDKNSLFQALDRYLFDSQSRQVVGKAARSLVEELFTIELMAEEINAVYREVVKLVDA